jgi:hypothetical protein
MTNIIILLYLESELGRTISNNKNIQISALQPFPQLDGKVNITSILYRIVFLKGLPAVLIYALKIVWQFGTLIFCLCRLPKPDFICVQVKFCFSSID